MDEMDRAYQKAAAERYLPEHRPGVQPQVQGVIVNPTLRHYFDQTANEDRSALEIDDWWDLPYVVNEGNERYTVRCLDGGAWDRSTWRGTFQTLELAIDHARALIAQGGPAPGGHLGLRKGQ